MPDTWTAAPRGLTSLRPDLVPQILAGDEPDGLSLRELLLGVLVRWEKQGDCRGQSCCVARYGL